jgi:serine protease AprX
MIERPCRGRLRDSDSGPQLPGLPTPSQAVVPSFHQDPMQLSRALLCAATLSLLPAEFVSAQTVTIAAANSGELSYQVGGLQVRRWTDAGVAKAAMSRDGGRTWRNLFQPDDRLHFVLAQYDPMQNDLHLPAPMGVPVQNRLFLVQFQTQILEPYQRELQQRGIEILHYLPENALFVRCDRSQLDVVRQLPFVRWAGDVQNGFKLDATLREFAASKTTDAKECNLVLASKSDRARLVAQIADLGGVVTDQCDGSVMIQARLTPSQLLSVMDLDTVTWADPTTEIGYDMDNARIQGGANYVEQLGGFTGIGVRAEITEGFEETHPDFTNFPGRVIVRGTNTVASHGHCTAGIVGGSGAGNSAARGMLPNATMIEGAYSSAGAIYSQAVGSTNPALPWRSMFATASWGSAVTTQYTSVSQAMDDALFAADLTRFNSQSNQSSQNSRPEAWAKNIISGGGVSHGNNANPADDVWTSASYGPASDGRQKPDICAYYDNVLTSDRSGASGYNTAAGVSGNYYTGFNGTSSATPICAGHMGIIQEMFTDDLFGNPLPMPATPANRFENKPHMTTGKALLCGTARPYPLSQVARRVQGWGFPDLARLYDNRNKIVVVDEYEALQMGQSRTYLVWVAPGAPEFRATMCYADPAALPSAAIHRINSVDLKVTRLSDGTFWWGNNGLANSDQTPSGGVPNDRDTIEGVLLSNPQAGLYEVRVTATSIVQDGKVETPAMDVDFALVIFPTGGGYLNRTGVTLDLQSSGSGDLSVNCSNVPATGWTDGFTSISFNTARAKGFGGFFGIEADFLTSAIWSIGATSGDVFHFTNSAASYPHTAYQFEAALIAALAGVEIDAQVTLWNGTSIVGQSNVDRITLQ